MQINFEKVNYTYNPKTPYEKKVLKDITLKINDKSFTAIIGKTGSGKSTFIEHINGLLIADSGYVSLDDFKIEKKKSKKETNLLEDNLIKIREDIAVLFQFSEQQLFETTVLKDIIFAPMNYGKTEEEAIKIAKDMIKLVGLSEDYLNRSPFELSGGEMRKVALCGVLAVKPKVLILDEPTIGLDFKSKKDFFELINRIYKEENITIVLVTHNMEYVLNYATDIIIMQEGQVKYITNDKIDFIELLDNNNYNLSSPDIIKIQKKLKDNGVLLSKFHYEYKSLFEELISKVGKLDE
ncbi:ATP-binding cassette domain-containing protein [Gemelliphila palaticanis]|uniref:Energy-coupling factor transporter ATPase n=1 Tax=Gemelliphila palaticanis TaxID=81950 RepID=A0ABX2T278_9BACL|nr:ATP-binding cassette domain-containing protein [Gemella palaticanis]MBF0715634.1 energy-coupling factor transporter ATPase [Gemella palaticanis]NYS47564.1 energy-coupling factor transporter ATPase [Gemella palaticanis]